VAARSARTAAVDRARCLVLDAIGAAGDVADPAAAAQGRAVPIVGPGEARAAGSAVAAAAVRVGLLAVRAAIVALRWHAHRGAAVAAQALRARRAALAVRAEAAV